jgi:NAD(P)-dependent dehydrogenase (short-subunit alcohol dehydrogenase family)
MEFQGKVAFVTGAASGLGLATARAFAQEGATVVINDIREAPALAAAREIGTQHSGLGGDISKEEVVKGMVETVLGRHGRIDILVNNAGIADSFVPTVDQPTSRWQRVIDVHLTGTYLMSKTVAPSMIARGSGVILNVSSIAGVLGLPVRTSYSAAKAGIAMMTRTLGCEWAAHGIRVNAVAPGYIKTPGTEKLIADGKIDEKRIQRRTPMGQMGPPQDIADAMLFLASDRARFITGVTLPVDGG